jgi:hypothetical protein
MEKCLIFRTKSPEVQHLKFVMVLILLTQQIRSINVKSTGSQISEIPRTWN